MKKTIRQYDVKRQTVFHYKSNRNAEFNALNASTYFPYFLNVETTSIVENICFAFVFLISRFDTRLPTYIQNSLFTVHNKYIVKFNYPHEAEV